MANTSSYARTSAFVVLTVVLFFVFAEAAVRLAAPVRESRLDGQAPQRRDAGYRPDPDLFWTLKPGAKLFGQADAINADGYRGAAVQEEKGPGTYRIVCLGDSCTFGMGVQVDEAYPAALQRLLDARLAGRVEVINAGVPGYTSLQGWRALESRWIDYRPDLVTAFFGWNDYLETAALPDELQAPWRNREIPFRSLLSRSRLYRELVTRIVTPKTPGRRVGVRSFARNFDRMHALCRNRGVDFFALTVPLNGRDYPYNPMLRHMKERGLPLVDLWVDLPWPRDELFQPDTTHPAAAGDAAIAELLADFLCVECELPCLGRPTAGSDGSG